MASRSFRRYLIFFMSLVFAVLAHRIITENDIFFHLRVGEEVVDRHRVILENFWAFTSPGALWYNHEWLATAVFKLFSMASSGSYDFLPTLRSLLVFVLSASLLTLAVESGHSRKTQVFSALVWVSAIYSACWFELRPELFGWILFVFLIRLWTHASNEKLAPIALVLRSLFILIVWSNFHSGTVPFGILFAGSAIFCDPRFSKWHWHKRFMVMLVCLTTWIVTPIGIYVIPLVLDTIGSPDPTMNPDFASLSFKLFDPYFAGFRLWLWLLLTILSLVMYLFIRKKSELSGPYRSPLFVLGVFVVYAVLSVAMVRTRFYGLAFGLPILVAAGHVLEKTLALSRRTEIALFGIPAALLGCALIFHSSQLDAPLGFGVDPKRFPISSARFLAFAKPEPQLLNNTNFGGYLIDQLREYRVADATSGNTAFASFEPERVAAMENPTRFQEFLRKYHIQAVIETLPDYRVQEGVIQNRHSPFFPKSDWALVFFDDASVVYLKRTPKNLDLIAKYEYHYLYRELPPEVVKEAPALPEHFKRGYQIELDRCLVQVPGNEFCARSKELFQSS